MAKCYMLYVTCCVNILGVRIDNLSKQQILEKVESFLSEPRFHQIATVNPEFILRAQRDQEFKKILNNCDLNVADGIGLKFAFIRRGAWLKSRFAGADLMDEIFQIAHKDGLKIFLAIHPNGLSSFQEIKETLKIKYPGLCLIGGNIDPKKDKKWPVIKDCSIVLCNFGFPRQEQFLHRANNGTIRLAMGVGGSFDYVTGKIQRAPKIMRLIGLEWLWRLILEPKYRLKRILNAVIIFPIKILLNKH